MYNWRMKPEELIDRLENLIGEIGPDPNMGAYVEELETVIFGIKSDHRLHDAYTQWHLDYMTHTQNALAAPSVLTKRTGGNLRLVR